VTDLRPAATALGMSADHGQEVTGPPRLIRETSVPMAECPGCGARMTLGVVGATWRIRSPSDVADRLVLQLGRLEREELHVLLLDTKNGVLGQERIYVGNVSASLVRVGELFTEAVRRCASRIVLCHNHPSGDPTPSPDDLLLTMTAIAAGRLLDIDVLDHVIVGRDTYVSLRDRGVAFGIPGDRRAGEASA
jgi:DNA repair protein RadC